MRLFAFALALPLVKAGSDSALKSRENVDFRGNNRPISKSFIVEFAPGSTQRRDGLASTEGVKVVKTFDNKVFNGASVETESHTLDSLLSLPDVVNVWPNVAVKLDPVESKRLVQGEDVAYTTHNATGVSKLHAQGIFGKGAKVGVVDTGIWYKHPDLGNGFGPGSKVERGYDFAGDGLWPYEGEKQPDEDPLDQQGHGSHVAGIVAAKGVGWSGVAPEATLYAYKIFSQYGFTDTATILEAFFRAYDDGVDIITASVGSNIGWATEAWSVIASRFVDEGIVTVVASGNVGTVGPFLSSTGATGKNVLAVASVDSQTFPAFPFDATFSGVDGGSEETFRFGFIPPISYDPFPATVVDVPIVPFSLDANATTDACEPLEPGSLDFTGKIVLVRRGTAVSCDIHTQQENLALVGGTLVLVYNDDRPLSYPVIGNTNSTVGFITSFAGKQIVDAIKAGRNVTADFSVNHGLPVALTYSLGGDPNYFTNIGPVYDLQIKPDIAAPGGKIYSTWIDDSYTIQSGTSMAAPYIAGVAALYVSVYGGRNTHPSGSAWAKDLGKRIISSGISVPWADGLTETDYGHSASVAQVGNGLVDAYKVLQYKTVIDYEKIALNDTRYFNRYHEISVTNNDEEAVTYKFSAESIVSADILGWYAADQVIANPAPGTKRVKEFFDMIPETRAPEISFPADFTLQSGESKTVSVNFKNPDTLGWNASGLPLYSGRVLISGSNGEFLSVPYLGLGGDLRKEVTPLEETNYAFMISTTSNTPVASKPYFTFNLSLAAQDFPRVISKPIYGIKETRWDVFEAGWTERQWKYPPVPGENGHIGTIASWVGSGRVEAIDTSIYDPNETFTYPIMDRNRNGAYEQDEHWWFGKLSNGSQIAAGNYTLRFALLKPFGDPSHADNWEVLQTPQISVL
ncbi:subtilase [Colletotrichum acutatum]|uniref:Subtilase n=1 Tax=Glomerella acutata TaxID=27357 RepID=A0AAD8UR00_GLOAC|nr:subtilase [Colletotrichum acutatum]KAK1724825.1 subtilase [Colletotrichum acutatum]